MEYKHVNGPVYCRFALTPPVINSELAHQIGIVAPYDFNIQAGSHVKLDTGSNVKLRLILDDRAKRITCHATVDWVKQDESAGECEVAFSRLSLTDHEFQAVLDSCVERPKGKVELVKSVREVGAESMPITVGSGEQQLNRVKAVTLPISLIEAVDERRGEVPFSEFVAEALWERIKS